ncbi:hypothetical protein LR69_01392 [Geobacillus sp. BCO2]|nr:hypothetical protein LR69_01392 [Geobacillus sp. BCO2]
MKRSFIYVLLVGIMVAWGLNVTALKIFGGAFFRPSR